MPVAINVLGSITEVNAWQSEKVDIPNVVRGDSDKSSVVIPVLKKASFPIEVSALGKRLILSKAQSRKT